MPTATSADTAMKYPAPVSMARTGWAARQGARLVSLSAAIGIIWITGCAGRSAGRSNEGPSSRASASQSAADQSLPPAAVRLLERGAPARALLRHKITARQSESVVMELSTRMTLAVGEMSPPEVRSPDVRLFLQLRATAVEPHGQATIEGTISKFELPPTPGVAPAVIAAVTSDLDKLRGSTFRLIVSDRGIIELLALPAPADANRQLLTTLDRVREGVRALFPPLPEAEVGQGARWEVRRKTIVGPAHVDETDVYTLLDSATGRGRVTAKIGLTAGEQNAAVPGLPPGATLTLASVSGTGSAETNLRADHLVPATTMQWTSMSIGSLQPAGEPPAPVRLLVTSAVSLAHAK